MKVKYLVALLSVAATPALAQAQISCGCYQVVPQVTYQPQTVTSYRLVQETVYETQQHTTYKPVWVTERRERKTTVLKPIQETSERVEEYTVLKPIVETSYEERTFEETILETVTEMREQEYYVDTPVTETTYQERQYVVRKPVVETVQQTEQVTVMRPSTVLEQRYATTNVPNTQWVQQPGGYTWPRLQYYRPGYYADPVTGGLTYQRGGLRWAQNQRPDSYQPQTTLTPTVVPYTVQQTTMVPETVTVQKPVQVTRYVEEVVTEKVPVTTQSTRREIVKKQVPVTVQRPATRIVTEKVPVQKTRYEQQIVTRKTPVTTITYQEIEQIEPYDVQVLKYVAETSEVQVPRTVTRRVPLTSTRLVPAETRYYRVPVTADRIVGQSMIIESSSSPVVVDSPAVGRTEVYYGTPTITSRPVSSVLESDSQTAGKPVTELTDVESPQQPEAESNNTGDDNVEEQPKSDPESEADRVPNLNNG